MRRRMGAAALDMDAASELLANAVARHRRRAGAQSRWPEGTVFITAVDAQTGEPVRDAKRPRSVDQGRRMQSLRGAL